MLEEDVVAALVDIVGADTWPLLDLLDRLEDRFDLGLVEDILEGDPAFVIVEENGEVDDDGPTIEKVFHLPSRGEGLRLGFVLDPTAAAGDRIDLHPWLSPVASWLIGGQPSVLVGDEPIDTWTEERVVHDELVDVLVGPDGWLGDLADRWVTATVTDGRLRLDAAGGPAHARPGGSRPGR